MSQQRAELVEQLRTLGVETVTAEYDGCGDSGQIHPPEFGSVEVSQVTVLAVQDLFYELLRDFWPGWELNEGSYGRFTWSVKEDRVHLIGADWSPESKYVDEAHL